MATSFLSDDLSGSEFVDVDLRGTRFVRVDLSGAVMRGVDVQDVDLDARPSSTAVSPAAPTVGPRARMACGRHGAGSS
jgi:uncharacterized protein YjbI with pentapeptide repeats